MNRTAVPPRAYPLATIYRRPAALDEPAEPHKRSVLSWLELEPLNRRPHRSVRRGDAAGSPRYAVVQAYPLLVAGEFTWVTDVLARGVTPLAGVQLVDGLRALRAVGGA